MRKIIGLLAGAFLFTSTTITTAQTPDTATLAPIPVEGTDMVMTEYGVKFPREIYWPKDGSIMVLIPSGTFTMGLDVSKGGMPAESPEHVVNMPSYYIDKFEVSNYQYGKFLVEFPAGQPRPSSNVGLLESERPVCGVTWNDAHGYAEWAGKQLPTEAMWEKAARGPKGTLYTTGSTAPQPGTVIINRGANGLTVSVVENTGDVSGYGIFHMGGNVSEWVADYYSREYYSDSPADNPKGPAVGETHVVRGASFFSQPDRIRVTLRSAQPPVNTRDEIGFRCAWIPVPPDPNVVTPTPSPSPTPYPTTQELLAGMAEQLLPYMKADAPRLPRQMMAGKAYTSSGESEVQFINLTPYLISLSMVGPEEGLVFKYNEPLPRMSYRNISLTKERDLYILAYAAGAPRTGPINLGFIRAESKAIVVIRSELFTPIQLSDGTEIPLSDSTEAEQYYSSFAAQWNVVEVENPLDEPLTLMVEDVTASLERPDPAGEFTIEANRVFRMTLQPGRYRLRADYIGALEPSSEPREVMINDRAARRLLTIREDTASDKRVTVITEKRPPLLLSLDEARTISPPK